MRCQEHHHRLVVARAAIDQPEHQLARAMHMRGSSILCRRNKMILPEEFDARLDKKFGAGNKILISRFEGANRTGITFCGKCKMLTYQAQLLALLKPLVVWGCNFCR
jgi:hypothetical protein